MVKKASLVTYSYHPFYQNKTLRVEEGLFVSPLFFGGGWEAPTYSAVWADWALAGVGHFHAASSVSSCTCQVTPISFPGGLGLPVPKHFGFQQEWREPSSGGLAGHHGVALVTCAQLVSSFMAPPQPHGSLRC